MFSKKVNFKPFSRPSFGLLHPAAQRGLQSSSSSSTWPESLGFVLWGAGPSFVIHVEPWSPLCREIAPGDQIAGLDDVVDVDRMSADALKALVGSRRAGGLTRRGSTPSLKVVSRNREVEIPPTKKFRYGFTVRGTMPVQVGYYELL